MYRSVEYEDKKQYFWNSVARFCLSLGVPRVRRSFSLKAKISENELIFFSLCSEKKCFFSLIFASSETFQESENNESKTKILSEKLKSLKVIFKYLDSKLVWHKCRILFDHEKKPLSHTTARGVCSNN
jgi:hypothetical protein